MNSSRIPRYMSEHTGKSGKMKRYFQMSSRGRGYGVRGTYGVRGGYRGSSYRGNNPRGSYEGRGRGGYNSHYNSHESRYNSGGGDRYNPGRSDRMDDSYKKPYRSESSNYSSRDYMSRGGSPDRKRMRMEGSGDRRSHDGGGHFGSSYGSRQDNYGERRSFGEERRRSPSREGYRKSGGMPPPRSPSRLGAPRSRVLRAPRRSFRGRTLRTRGTYRGTMRSRGSYYPRRFSERPHDYTRTFRLTKMRSSIKAKGDSASSTEGEDWDTEEKEEGVEDGKEVKIKSPKSAAEEETAGAGGAGAGGDTDKEGGDAASDDNDLPRSKFTGRRFIALFCVHCKEKCITFGGYSKHLMSSKHHASMGAVARRHKAQLLRMRMAQRSAQRELEATEEAELAPHSAFCLVCKLNHRTTRHAHNLTDTHRAMKRFLMPFCRVCRISFRSPMIYEHHICSLDHIKRKAHQTMRPISPKGVVGSGDEGMDVDLDNFMTLDSVGDVDEVEDEDSGTEKKPEEQEEKSVKKPKVEINIGSEHIKKVEVHWCELCKIYLRRAEVGSVEEADVLRRHCRLRNHLGRYVRHRDTRTLRRHAERIHRQLQQQKEGGKEEGAGEVKEEKPEGEGKKKPAENGTDALVSSGGGGEDKLWADVDKDIGELLREVDPAGNKSSDDDEDLGRYDKFRKSDKKLEGGAAATGEAEAAGAEAGGDDTAAADLSAPL